MDSRRTEEKRLLHILWGERKNNYALSIVSFLFPDNRAFFFITWLKNAKSPLQELLIPAGGFSRLVKTHTAPQKKIVPFIYFILIGGKAESRTPNGNNLLRIALITVL
jgi:hypothetical protein